MAQLPDTSRRCEHVRQLRVWLGLPATPPSGDDLTQVPADLDQTFSGVREVQGKLMQAASALGISGSFDKLPHEMENGLLQSLSEADIDQIFAKLSQGCAGHQAGRTKLLASRTQSRRGEIESQLLQGVRGDRRRHHEPEA